MYFCTNFDPMKNMPTAGQGCRARLPGKAAGQGCRARLPGKAAGQSCRARLPAAAGQGCMQWCNMLKAELFGRPSPRTSLKSESENFGLRTRT
jgi:hypothetical protein